MSIPILGQPAQAADPLDMLDSEIQEIERVTKILSERSKNQRRDFDKFDREIKERFAEIGWVVSVQWWSGAGPDNVPLADFAMPTIQFEGRTEKKTFDRDQMTHEVTNDILGLGQKGTISTKGAEFAAQMRAEEAKHKAHGNH